jgi:hypothetical protein
LIPIRPYEYDSIDFAEWKSVHSNAIEQFAQNKAAALNSLSFAQHSSKVVAIESFTYLHEIDLLVLDEFFRIATTDSETMNRLYACSVLTRAITRSEPGNIEHLTACILNIYKFGKQSDYVKEFLSDYIVIYKMQ